MLGFCHRGCLFSLYGILVVPYGSPRLSGLVCWSVRFPLLQGGCASSLWVWGPALAAPFVQSLQLFFVGCPSAVPVYPPQALEGQVVWSWSFPPSCCSWRLCSLSVSAAAFCPLAISSHPLLLLLLAWGFILWRLFRLGLVGCGPVLDPPFYWGGGTLLPLSSWCLLACSNCFVAQAPWVSRTLGWGFLPLASCVC